MYSEWTLTVYAWVLTNSVSSGTTPECRHSQSLCLEIMKSAVMGCNVPFGKLPALAELLLRHTPSATFLLENSQALHKHYSGTDNCNVPFGKLLALAPTLLKHNIRNVPFGKLPAQLLLKHRQLQCTFGHRDGGAARKVT